MIPTQFKINTRPIARKEAMVRLPEARFTILTSRLIRMEYDLDGAFEDRPSQVFWFRNQPVPGYEVCYPDNGCEIITDHLRLVYTGGNFNRDTLSIASRNHKFTWHFGDTDKGNLGGTARTLDNVCGQTHLEPGLISRDGWTIIDDSNSLVFNEDGWLKARDFTSEYRDIYFFGYGQDYLACLRDYCKTSGSVPIIPRWSLGNWWSRFWAFTQQELSDLMLDFRDHHVPLGVCITDMDWHLSGWTGYTWNRELFPDPVGYLDFLHSLGLHTALNLHPASGVHPHEEMYLQMALAMGIDPASKQPVKFDIEDPDFARAYFDILHHPLEEQGVDFWWMDWQQGNPTRLPGLNILWWINHLHFLDLARSYTKRSFIFSRWGGLGNHRYPIGFSGDTVVDWDSLAFQPYFTATAANVDYGWWSHDIGGHMHGVEDAELYARWVQFGAFGPILRLHCTNNPFHERRPWAYDAEIFRVVQFAMQLRHAMIPYLYSMSWRNHISGIPLVLPMYYLSPGIEDAYACPNQYMFGSELVVAPVITPSDPDTGLARTAFWLPDGDWYDFFSGQYYPGGGWQTVYSGLGKIPVFARAGAIIPLGTLPSWGGLDNPAELVVHVFPGADNSFDLYEDDGSDNACREGQYAITHMSLKWEEQKQSFSIEPADGNPSFILPKRGYTIVFHSIQQLGSLDLYINGRLISAEPIFSQIDHTLSINNLSLLRDDRLEIYLRTKSYQVDWRVEIIRSMLREFRLASDMKHSIDLRIDEIIEAPDLLAAYHAGLTLSQIHALVEVIASCGVEHIKNAGEELLVLWNRRSDKNFTYSISAENIRDYNPKTKFSIRRGVVSNSTVYRPQRDFTIPSLLTVNYHNLVNITFPFGVEPVT